MDKENKYYYISYYNSPYSSQYSQPQLVKWNKDYMVDVDENVDFNQRLSLIVNKLSGDKIEKPKSNEFEKVKPVLKEIFLDYYYHALRNIGAAKIEDGEHYLIQRGKTWYQVEYYSKDEKNKLCLTIDFRDGIEDLWLMVGNNHGHKGRPNARKNGNPIKYKEFQQFLNLTLKFLSDPDSYKIYLDSYVKNFYNLTNGDILIEGFDINSERAFKMILAQLEERKATIEKRLIEDDNDSSEDRTALRGEIEGIKYAIKTINIHK